MDSSNRKSSRSWSVRSRGNCARRDPPGLVLRGIDPGTGDVPILSPNDFHLARELAGFDGEHYWELRLDAPHSQGDEVFNALTLVPKEEAVLGPRFPGDPAYLPFHLRYTQLGRKVARFGFDSYQFGPPEYKSVPRPTYVSEDRIAKIQGPPRRPDALVFEPVVTAQGIALLWQELTYDYEGNTIDFFVGKDDERKHAASIRLISVEHPAAIADATFSWRSYEAIAGQKITVIQTQHEVLQAHITPDGVQTGAVITAIAQPDLPTPTSDESSWFVPTLIVLAAAGAAFLAKYAHDAAPRNKEKRE